MSALNLAEDNIDMIAATSIMQQQASDVRSKTINWASYMQSQMISQEDFQTITALDKARSAFLLQNPSQSIKTLLNLVTHLSKDSTIQYILVMTDDLLAEDRSRVDLFHEHGTKRKACVWGPFLNLLNRQDDFIVNMSSRILAKFACWSRERMPKSDLNFYLQFLKDQLMAQCDGYIREMVALAKKVKTVVTHSNTPVHGQGHGHGQGANHGHAHQYNISAAETAGACSATAQKTELPLNETYRALNAEAQNSNKSLLPNNESIQSVARCLQMMLRIDDYRFAFVSVDGISALVRILTTRVNFQVQYQLIFCLWVLTFNPLLAAKMNKFSVIPILADILSDSAKEKVTRIILAVFRNLIEKPEEAQVAKEHCIAMVQCKVLKQLDILVQRRFDDEDITADVEYLSEKLQNSVQDLSSFDEYATEVRSGRLEWSPVHKSSKFWRENAQRLNEKNYELLRILVHLLETSRDPIILSVACYDFGEYVRHYPRGKHVLEQLEGKQLVMQLLAHEDANVRYEALLAVQKLMVHNWEYLGKQLEKDSENQIQKQGATPVSGKA